MVGLQGQVGPLVKRVKELVVEEQAIGRVLSSIMNLATGLSTDVTYEGYEYLNDVELDGNMLVIPLGHLYDSVSHTLGELRSVSATLSTQQKDVAVKAKDGATVKYNQTHDSRSRYHVWPSREWRPLVRSRAW